MAKKDIVAPIIGLEDLIHEIREQKVILDADLARIYGVSTKRLNEQVKRNKERFPADFAFQLTAKESAALRSQFATSSSQEAESEENVPNRRKLRPVPRSIAIHVCGPTPSPSMARLWPQTFSIARGRCR